MYDSFVIDIFIHIQVFLNHNSDCSYTCYYLIMLQLSTHFFSYSFRQTKNLSNYQQHEEVSEQTSCIFVEREP